MLLLDPCTEPAWNIAAEQYLLMEQDSPVVRLWRNEPCVVMGRHQNPYQEIDAREVRRRGLPLLRRLSGGGTVYHDLGNINFTFILPVEESRQIDFQRTLQPVVDALHRLGVPAQCSGKSDLRLHGLKISGNAMYTWRKRCLQHGTLLYSADLDALQAVLVGPESDYRSRAIASNRSKVTNISAQLPEPPPVEAFMTALLRELTAVTGDDPAHVRTFTGDERARIDAIRRERYDTWEWTYGHSPRYELRRSLSVPGESSPVDLHIVVEHGTITQATLPEPLAEFSASLVGTPHLPERIELRLESWARRDERNALSLAQLLEALF